MIRPSCSWFTESVKTPGDLHTRGLVSAQFTRIRNNTECPVSEELSQSPVNRNLVRFILAMESRVVSQLSLCVLCCLTLSRVNCQSPRERLHLHLQENHEADTLSNRSRELKTKRDVSDEAITNCQTVQSAAGLPFITEVKLLQYNFFIKPQPGFRSLAFQMKIDNTWDLADAYLSDKNVSFNELELENSTSDPWKEVRIQYYREEVSRAPDTHGLQVSVGTLSRTLNTGRWWRTHSYEGFRILVQGPAELQFNCHPDDLAQTSDAHTTHIPLLGSILGGAFFLVVVMPAIYFVICKRQPKQHCTDQPPAIPPLPESLLLRRENQDKREEVIYEEFDEEKLTRLRQQLASNTFTYYEGPEAGKTSTSEGSKTTKKTGAKGTSPENLYENLPTLSLIDQKQKAKLEASKGNTSPVESHYVEMHGIIRSNSDLTN